jgi:TRAP-type uncharacterized transport system substrate-binding protein
MRRLLLWFYLAAGLVVLVALGVTVQYIGPVPPRVVVMSTGTPGSAYEAFAQRYKTILARSGVELRLMPSGGAVENLRRLNDPQSGVSVGFAQGGLTSEAQSPDLVSLGTLFSEPLWFFYRGVKPGLRLQGLRGRKMAIGPEGSGTRALVLELLARNGIDQNVAQLLPLPAAEAAERLLRGEIDDAMMVAAWDSQAVQRLLAAPEVGLVGFPRADAYVELYPFLDKLVLRAGVANMATNRPSVDTNLLAPKASLIVRRDLHRAIQYLLLEAATEIHSGPGVFQRPSQFPAAEVEDLPLSEDAQHFYRSGRPFLQRYLPFWLAVFVGRLLVVLIPVVGVAYPLMRGVPALYGWGMRRRIFRLYGELKFIELELERRSPGQGAADLLAQLGHLEARANHLRVTVAFAHFLYNLRSHIALVRGRLQQHGV